MLIACLKEGVGYIRVCPIVQTRYFAIVISCILHLVVRITVFIDQSKDNNAETSSLATYIVYLSMMDLIYSDELIPFDCSQLSILAKFIVELLLTVFMGEVCLIAFWSNIEMITLSLLNSHIDTDDQTLQAIHSYLLIALSLFISWIVSLETNRMEKLCSLFEFAKQIKVESHQKDGARQH